MVITAREDVQLNLIGIIENSLMVVSKQPVRLLLLITVEEYFKTHSYLLGWGVIRR